MDIPFTKMHGLGNDFILIEEDQLPPDTELSALAQMLCERHFGIGADGLIIVAPADDPNCDIQFKFYNNDGSSSAMCGNGIRCFARYVKDQGLIKRHEFKIQTQGGSVIPHLNPDHTVTVDMGRPILHPDKIPFTGTEAYPVIDFALTLPNNGSKVPVSVVSMGNPHCVIFVDKLSTAPNPAEWGPIIENHPLFPERTNVEFVEIQSRRQINLRVWERSVGLTLACGSGACAAVAMASLKGLVDESVTVKLPGGPLTIQWNSRDHIMMTGPATYVYVGTIPYVSPVAVA